MPPQRIVEQVVLLPNETHRVHEPRWAGAAPALQILLAFIAITFVSQAAHANGLASAASGATSATRSLTFTIASLTSAQLKKSTGATASGQGSVLIPSPRSMR
jgi:hypothetical protein